MDKDMKEEKSCMIEVSETTNKVIMIKKSIERLLDDIYNVGVKIYGENGGFDDDYEEFRELTGNVDDKVDKMLIEALNDDIYKNH
jgi:hypothetical protein